MPAMGLKPIHIRMLQLLAEGHKNVSIGFAVGTSEQVVKNQLRVIRKILGAETTVQAVVMALQFRLIKFPAPDACGLRRRTNIAAPDGSERL